MSEAFACKEKKSDGCESVRAASLTVPGARSSLGKKKQYEKQQRGMFGSGKVTKKRDS